MSRTGCRLATIVLVGALVMGVPSVDAGAVGTPDGFQRVPVQGAPVSLAVPDDWEIQSITRAQAKKWLSENPQLAAQGTTVDQLLDIPLTAGRDADGDSFSELSLTVQLFDVDGLPSISALRTDLAMIPGIEGLTVKRGTVAKRPALVATYTQAIARSDGVQTNPFATSYLFVPRPGHGVMLQFFRSHESDAEAAAITDTMIKTVKVR